MNTDSLGQIYDRMIVEKLKEFHFVGHGDSKSEKARKQAWRLGKAADELLLEYTTGDKVPHVNESIRFHDHKDLEKKDFLQIHAYKQTTITECVELLAWIHYSYWELQTEIQEVKKNLDGELPIAIPHSPEDVDAHTLNARFVELQRKIDLCNQHRNNVRDKLDVIVHYMFVQPI